MSAGFEDGSPVISPEAVPPSFRPRVAPDYWDGQVLGGADAEPMPKPANLTDTRFAIGAVHTVLGTEVGYEKLFLRGDRFEYWRYRPGRVIIFNQEMLLPAESDVRHGDMTELELDGEPLPEVPSALDPPLGDRDHPYARPQHRFGGALVYQNWLRYAVVTPARGGDKRLVSLHASSVQRPKKGRRALVPDRSLAVDAGAALPRLEETPLVVGEVYHLQGKKGDPRLMRVTTLAVVSEEGSGDLSTA